MNPQNSKDEELRRREQELRDREHAIRLREIEAEITQPPVSPTVRHDRPSGRMTQRMRELVKTAKFVGLIAGAGILFVIVFRVGTFLATVAIIGIIGWVAYKLFFEPNRPKR